MNQHTFRRATEELLAAHKAVDAAREHFIRAALVLTDGAESPIATANHPIIIAIKRKRIALYADILTAEGGDGAFFRVEPIILQLAKLTDGGDHIP